MSIKGSTTVVTGAAVRWGRGGGEERGKLGGDATGEGGKEEKTWCSRFVARACPVT